jgi:hypothetical protein
MLNFLILSLCLAHAGKPSQFNTQVHVQESSESSFVAVVKIVREIQGETQVFFEGKSGFYTLSSNSPSFGSIQSLLVESQKKKFAVSVKVNDDTKTLLSAVRQEGE